MIQKKGNLDKKAEERGGERKKKGQKCKIDRDTKMRNRKQKKRGGQECKKLDRKTKKTRQGDQKKAR